MLKSQNILVNETKLEKAITVELFTYFRYRNKILINLLEKDE